MSRNRPNSAVCLVTITLGCLLGLPQQLLGQVANSNAARQRGLDAITLPTVVTQLTAGSWKTNVYASHQGESDVRKAGPFVYPSPMQVLEGSVKYNADKKTLQFKLGSPAHLISKETIQLASKDIAKTYTVQGQELDLDSVRLVPLPLIGYDITLTAGSVENSELAATFFIQEGHDVEAPTLSVTTQPIQSPVLAMLLGQNEFDKVSIDFRGYYRIQTEAKATVTFENIRRTIFGLNEDASAAGALVVTAIGDTRPGSLNQLENSIKSRIRASASQALSISYQDSYAPLELKDQVRSTFESYIEKLLKQIEPVSFDEGLKTIDKVTVFTPDKLQVDLAPNQFEKLTNLLRDEKEDGKSWEQFQKSMMEARKEASSKEDFVSRVLKNATGNGASSASFPIKGFPFKAKASGAGSTSRDEYERNAREYLSAMYDRTADEKFNKGQEQEAYRKLWMGKDYEKGTYPKAAKLFRITTADFNAVFSGQISSTAKLGNFAVSVSSISLLSSTVLSDTEKRIKDLEDKVVALGNLETRIAELRTKNEQQDAAIEQIAFILPSTMNVIWDAWKKAHAPTSDAEKRLFEDAAKAFEPYRKAGEDFMYKGKKP